MMRELGFVVGLMASVGSALAGPNSIVLVQNGEPASVIVLADKPTKAARQAALELQSWLRKMSGAEAPIVAEGRLPKETPNTLILVGDTSRTANLGLRSTSLALEEVQIRTFPGGLAIIGDDARPDGVALSGTLGAVEEFAERFLGVRVLWPGALGEVVPKRPTIEVGDINFRYAPVLRKREIRNSGYSDRIQKGLDKLGWSADDFKRHAAESKPWFQFQRLGGNFNGNYGHSFGTYWARFSKSHSEWFAMQPDGTRDNSRANSGERAQMCVSNRSLIEQVARDCIERLRKDPALNCVSVSPNDGGQATFCQCEVCKSWDAPDGEMIESWGPNGTRLRHVSLTDRYVKFYSAVAEIVAKELPNRYIGAYAYSAYRLPPVHAKLHPNVIIGYVGGHYLNDTANKKSLDNWLKWSQAANQLFLRPNSLIGGLGFPTIYVHRLADDIRFCVEHKMMLGDFDCCYQHWAGEGLNYYVLAKLLWNPKADVDAIISDYCRAGFGPAAEAIQEYYRYVESATSEFARLGSEERQMNAPEQFAAWCKDDFFARCNALLDAADRAAGNDDVVRQRIAFLRKAVEMGRIRHDWATARATAKQGDRDAAKRVKKIEAERDAWYKQLGLSWAVNAPSLRFQNY
jgi:hypothetical protein